MSGISNMPLLGLLFTGLISCVAPNTDSEAVQENTVEPLAMSDPLPSWNDGERKQAIIAYVNNVTNEASTDFIPVADRIATFDNDGTLWSVVDMEKDWSVVYPFELNRPND